MESKVGPKLWIVVTLTVAIIGCIGLIGAAVIGVLPNFIKLSPEVVNDPSTVVVTQIVMATQVVQPTPTSETQLGSSPTIVTTIAPSRNNVEVITVSGNDSDGTEWYAPVSGTYILYFQEGAYNGWESDTECSKTDHAEQGCWKTTIFIYQNCDIKRGGSGDMVEPINPDFRIGDDAWQTSIENAEKIAKTNNELRIDLEIGACLSFIAIDGIDENTGFSAYSDNRGSISIGIDFMSK